MSNIVQNTEEGTKARKKEEEISRSRGEQEDNYSKENKKDKNLEKGKQA